MSLLSPAKNSSLSAKRSRTRKNSNSVPNRNAINIMSEFMKKMGFYNITKLKEFN